MNTKLKKELKQNKDQIRNLDLQIEALKEHCVDKDTNLDELGEKIQRLTKVEKNLQGKLNALEDKLSDMKVKNETLSLEIKQLKSGTV